MRQHVSKQVILSGSVGDPATLSAVAYTRSSVLVSTPSFFKLGVLFHEITHILDSAAPPLRRAVTSRGYPEGTLFSRTVLWTRAILNDSATQYAQSTLEEVFADAGRWAMSGMVTREGLGTFSQGWEACGHQTCTYERWLAGVVFTERRGLVRARWIRRCRLSCQRLHRRKINREYA